MTKATMIASEEKVAAKKNGSTKLAEVPKASKVTVPSKPSWWNVARLARQDSVAKYGPAIAMMIDHAVALGRTVYTGSCRGVLEEEDEKGQREFLTALRKAANMSQVMSGGPISGRGTYDFWLMSNDGAIVVEIGLDGKVTAYIAVVNENIYMAVAGVIGDYMLAESVRQPIYSLAEGPQGIEIVEIGLGGKEFERGNYDDGVIEAFDFICDELQRDPPLGRLSLLQGEPGTGKTFFVRGVLNHVLDAVFVLIPSYMVENLAGPKLIPMLIKARGLAGNDKPIVLVIEDADRCLVPRESEQGSLAAISTLLNMSDGILGHSLNLRVFATTNAQLEEIDEALRRPGRLSKHVHIGPLSKEKAEEVYTRLTEGEETEFEGPTSLATVYQLALSQEILEDEDEDDDETDEDEFDEEEEEDGDESEGDED